jgi:hypothetical protein
MEGFAVFVPRAGEKSLPAARDVKAAFLALKVRFSNRIEAIENDTRSDWEDRVDLQRDIMLHWYGAVLLMKTLEERLGQAEYSLVSRDECTLEAQTLSEVVNA